jgi:hypothetical protein
VLRWIDSAVKNFVRYFLFTPTPPRTKLAALIVPLNLKLSELVLPFFLCVSGFRENLEGPEEPEDGARAQRGAAEKLPAPNEVLKLLQVTIIDTSADLASLQRDKVCKDFGAITDRCAVHTTPRNRGRALGLGQDQVYG